MAFVWISSVGCIFPVGYATNGQSDLLSRIRDSREVIIERKWTRFTDRFVIRKIWEIRGCQKTLGFEDRLEYKSPT